MNTNQHIAEDDLLLLALQFLSEEQIRAMAPHLEHCELCRAKVGEFQGDLTAYALTAEMSTPPAAARERLLRKVAKERRVVPITARPAAAQPAVATAAVSEAPSFPQTDNVYRFASFDEPRPRPGMGIGGWLGWALAAGLAVTVGLGYNRYHGMQLALNAANERVINAAKASTQPQEVLDAMADPHSLHVALHIPDKGQVPRPEGRAAYNADKGALVFLAANLDPLQPYKTYELWLIPANGQAPVPAGLFKPDINGNAVVILPALNKGLTAKTFAVTVEDEGGSKAPTSAPILAGL